MRYYRWRGWYALFMLLFISFIIQTRAWTQTTEQDMNELWEDVTKAEADGLPKTAIKHLNTIIPRALEREQYGDALKALSKKIVLEATIQGNKPDEKIKRLQKEIDESPSQLRILMKLVLARWYWHYYQGNRWRFSRREATDEMSDDDFTTWDLPRLFAEIDELYTEVLSHASELQNIPIEKFSTFFTHGNVPLSYRPTIFDFAAFSAISFYQDGDQLRKKPEDEFELSADSDALAPADSFITYEPKTTDTESPKLKALNLYKALLTFHQHDIEKSAFIDADIHRLNFVKAYSFGDEKSERYLNRLAEIVERYPTLPLASLACYFQAYELYTQNKYVEAHTIAHKGMALHPDSAGSQKCHNLIATIETKEMKLQSEYSVMPSGGEAMLEYRNIDTVYFRIVEDRWDEFLRGRWENPYQRRMCNEKYRELLEKKPVQSWALPLSHTTDYKMRSQDVELPSLTPGFYRLIASWKEDFSWEDNAMTITSFWVTKIAIIQRNAAERIEGFVLDAEYGEPLEEAEIRVFHRDKEGYFKKVDTLYTDKDGLFSISPLLKIFSRYQRDIALYARYKEYEALYPDLLYQGRSSPREESVEQTLFFTDRSLYRPGQHIHFKVLAIKNSQNHDTYDFLPHESLTITLKDHNYQEIEKIRVITNEFGSASGTFTAPSGKYTGTMSITCDTISGATTIRVEEYKRPKFKVTLDPPHEQGKLNKPITISGLAMAYTGAPIDDARISYRVVREVRYPFWWYWYGQPPSPAREIIHGKGKTDEQGSFRITFPARADLAIPEKDEPIFIFKVAVDITDSSGETRSAERRIQLGYSAMTLDMSAPEWLTSDTPSIISIASKTLDGELTTARGVVKVFTLKQPEMPVKPSFFRHSDRDAETGPDVSDWKIWEQEREIENAFFDTSDGPAEVSFLLAPGAYKIVATALDRFGKRTNTILPVMILSPSAKSLDVPIPDLLTIKSQVCEIGDSLSALWGTGYKKGRAFVEIEHRNKIVKKFWTEKNVTQQMITWAVQEEHRGGFHLHVTHVKDNRAYCAHRYITVPWSNKKLQMSFSSFRSKLEPGSKETWTIMIQGPESEKVAAELVATLYDISLDAFYPHSWQGLEYFFRRDYTMRSASFGNRGYEGIFIIRNWNTHRGDYEIQYWQFPFNVLNDFNNFAFPHIDYEVTKYHLSRYKSAAPHVSMDAMSGEPPVPQEEAKVLLEAETSLGAVKGDREGKVADKTDIDLSTVSARTNLNETAFFFPHLTTDSQGNVSLTFTMPEALTEWKFLGFAHARELLWGMIVGTTVTQKDLMVQPNPPRFMREGDVLFFTAKVTNLSDEEQNGSIRLTLTDAITGNSLDKSFSNIKTDQDFSIPAQGSRSFSWEINVPDYSGFLTYKVVASSGRLSDGEENSLPVLSRRIFVTESLPIPIRGPETKKFSFTKLLESGQSSTLQHKALTVQMVSNPAWYAVGALPYLMEFPHQCSEQVFNRLYANALARHIALSDPTIKRIFSLWRETDALVSNLEKNEDLKSVLLDETPWVRAAQNETQAKHRIGLLFDDNHMEDAFSRAYETLSTMQLSDGAWPWFPGGRPNSYITLYIMTGFGRLRHLDVQVTQDLAFKSLNHCDAWIKDTYDYLKQKGFLNRNNLTSTIALYLYGRSFFIDSKPIPENALQAVHYFLDQAARYWLKMNSRLSQGHLALACNRFGDTKTAEKIMASLKERSVSDEEMGMFWRELEHSWWWYRAPIDTQALMIEAFDEVAHDEEAVEDLKVWLLKQKQTQDWKTTKATAEAVYALLLKGKDLLASDELVSVTLGTTEIRPEKVEAGTGFYEKKFIENEIKPDYGKVTVTKIDEGVAWGSLHWQYMEDMSKVTPHKTPLHCEKRLFVKQATKKGPVIKPVQDALAVGDLLVVRIVLRVDRDMEYMHMKDYRGSGTEPVNVLSRYKYQDGLAYYESTKDVATHFFIDYLPKGTYVFEYPLRIQHRGVYQMGIAAIECMYAPEFNSHSASEFITVQ
ncbi:MAG: alpha-2-macroglobulin family protein [bacterium]